MREKIKRLVTSTFYFLIVMSAVFINRYEYILVLILLQAFLSFHELFNVVDLKEKKFFKIFGYITILLYFISGIFAKNSFKFSKEIIFVNFLIISIYTVLKFKKIEFKEITKVLFTYIYIPFLIFFVPEIFNMKNGNILYLFLMFTIMSTDSGAYLIGSRIGKHKLTKLSPNKSVEGSVGGLISSIAVNIALYFVILKVSPDLFKDINIYVLIPILILISVIGQFGDLIASYIKRVFNKKDYGKILLGHGGMLDRIDSLILAAPAAFMLFKHFLI